ncbi:urease accessory protein UreD [Microtetraspora niveoalba]|uniref:urease accessory protein UreD n=1 Tax=Microtetraspora niveoalba TaxID=46175 RepID=UPI001FE09D46|nr:urease accessory protein UreD [Microtetraspora niveoalba]
MFTGALTRRDGTGDGTVADAAIDGGEGTAGAVGENTRQEAAGDPGKGRQGAAAGGPPPDRLAPEWYTLSWVPEEVTRYSRVPDTLPVGSPGKVGVLDLAFARTARRTEVSGHFQKSPLQIMRPHYYDPGRPDMAYVMLLSSGGGILQGDRYRTDVVCGPGTAVHLTTQAATRIYRMEQDYATQLVRLTAGPDSYLEYLPDAVIPFADSRYYQRVEVVADPSATVVIGDMVLAGRLARGERHAYTAFCGDLEVAGPDGETVFADTVRLVPGDAEVAGPAVFGDFGVMGSLFVVTGAVPASEMADALHRAVAPRAGPPDAGLRAGASVLPGERGAWVRALGPESPPVGRVLRAAWDAARRLVLGVPAPEPRKR